MGITNCLNEIHKLKIHKEHKYQGFYYFEISYS